MHGNSPCRVWRNLCTSTPAFRYSPLLLQQIRILNLHPGEFDSPIVISLDERDLEKTEQTYEALSYVWGQSKRKVAVECNGAKLLITESLEIALRRLRYRNKSRILWVYAICIDQDDKEERAQQVPLMKEIYPKAIKVLVWLGEADQKIELALKAIDEWATFNRLFRQNSDATRFSKFEERFGFKPGYRDTLEAVGTLTYRPWFNRCWTFQEIILSTQAELHIGKYQLTWDCFFHALEAFPIHLLADDVLNFNALFMCHGKAKTQKSSRVVLNQNSKFGSGSQSDSIPVSRNLSRVLQITRNFTATDPRDKIFSVLSMATMKNPYIFRPNYNKSVRETFISLTLAMIRDEDSLNVLMSCGEQSRDKNLPSWCPDWSCKRGVTLAGYYDYISYAVNGGLHPNLTNLKMNKNYELELDGSVIDTVKEVHNLEVLSTELKASLKDINFTNVLSKFARAIGLHNCLLHDQLSPEATLFRTLTADHWFFGAHLRGSYKEIWFPTHLRFRNLKRNIEARMGLKMSHEFAELLSPDAYRSNILDRPKLDVNSMGSLSLEQETTVVDIENHHKKPDHEVESPFTHAVIDKVYRQTSPFYIEGQDFDDAKNIDRQTLLVIANEAISQAIFFFKGKSILISEHGFVAIGSDETKVGDTLCSFWGADVPFVLRKKQSCKSKKSISINQNSRSNDVVDDVHEIVSECYIDGIMYGELFSVLSEISSWTDSNPYPSQTIQPHVNWVRKRKFRIA